MLEPTYPPRAYQLAVAFSILFALAGFSYNVWRMEVSEQNNNTRTACFEILRELSALEQLIYTARYDGDLNEGSPRKGWVKVGLIRDLSALTPAAVSHGAAALAERWAEDWDKIAGDTAAVDRVVVAIDAVRGEIKQVLRGLD